MSQAEVQSLNWYALEKNERMPQVCVIKTDLQPINLLIWDVNRFFLKLMSLLYIIPSLSLLFIPAGSDTEVSKPRREHHRRHPQGKVWGLNDLLGILQQQQEALHRRRSPADSWSVAVLVLKGSVCSFQIHLHLIREELILDQPNSEFLGSVLIRPQTK